MRTTITATRDGWLIITLPSGMQVIAPQDDDGTDMRAEIRARGQHVFVEDHWEGLCVSKVEECQ